MAFDSLYDKKAEMAKRFGFDLRWSFVDIFIGKSQIETNIIDFVFLPLSYSPHIGRIEGSREWCTIFNEQLSIITNREL